MTVPTIQYTQTTDGYRIAFTDTGEGIPLVLLPQPVNHLKLMWRAASLRTLYEGLAQRFRLIQYDGRGMGMSQRGLPEGFRVEDYALDLDAIVEHLGLQRFIVLAPNGHALVAVYYASANPERVLALMLWQLIGTGRNTEVTYVAAHVAPEWQRHAVYSALVFLPGETLTDGVKVINEALTPADFAKVAAAVDASTVEHLLAGLRLPVLLMYKDIPFRNTAAWASKMAAAIPGAQLAMLDDDGDLYGYPRNSAQLIGYVDDFTSALELPSKHVAPRGGSTPALTPREREVLALIARGALNKEIAATLGLSVRTVARHITNVYAKLDVRSKAEATSYALRHRIS